VDATLAATLQQLFAVLPGDSAVPLYASRSKNHLAAIYRLPDILSVARLTTFGGLGLTVGDRPVDGPVAQRRRLLLLAVLGCEFPAALSRKTVGDLLWGGIDAESSRNNLRQAVFALRRGLAEVGEVGEPVMGSAELTLNPALIDADCLAFKTAIESGNQIEAIRLYRGSFLAGVTLGESVAFTSWVETRRAKFAMQFRSACIAEANAAAAREDWDRALDAWLALRAHEPQDRVAIDGVLRALVRADRLDDATRHASAFDALTVTEVAGTPNTATALLQRLVRRNPATLVVLASTPHSTTGSFSVASATAIDDKSSGRVEAKRTRSAGITTRTKVLIGVGLLVLGTVSATGVWRREFMNASSNTGGTTEELSTDGGLISIVASRNARSDRSRNTVVVDPFVLLHGKASADSLSELVQSAIVRRIGELGTMRAVSESAYSSVLIGHQLSLTVSGRYEAKRPLGSGFTFFVTIRGARDSLAVQLEPIAIGSEVHSGADMIALRVQAAVAALTDSTLNVSYPAYYGHLPLSLDALNRLDEGLTTNLSGDPHSAIVLLRSAVGPDSSFLFPLLAIARAQRDAGNCDSTAAIVSAISRHHPRPAESLLGRLQVEWCDGNWAAYGELSRQLAALRPTASSARASIVSAEATMNHLVRADSLIRAGDLDPLAYTFAWIPGVYHGLAALPVEDSILDSFRPQNPDLRAWQISLQADDFAAEGRDRAVDSVLALLPAVPPGDVNMGEIFLHAAAEAMSYGRRPLAEKLLRSAASSYSHDLETYPDRLDISAGLARTRLFAGQWSDADRLYRSIAKRRISSSDQNEVRGALGVIAMHLGDQLGADKGDAWLAHRSLRFSHGIPVMWRARIAALRGEDGRALELLRNAVALGYPRWYESFYSAAAVGSPDPVYRIPEFFRLHSSPEYQSVMAPQ